MPRMLAVGFFPHPCARYLTSQDIVLLCNCAFVLGPDPQYLREIWLPEVNGRLTWVSSCTVEFQFGCCVKRHCLEVRNDFFFFVCLIVILWLLWRVKRACDIFVKTAGVLEYYSENLTVHPCTVRKIWVPELNWTLLTFKWKKQRREMEMDVNDNRNENMFILWST